MFTLPVDKPQDPLTGVMPGKVSYVRTWRLQVTGNIGYLDESGNWYAVDGLHQGNISVKFGDTILYDQGLGQFDIESLIEDTNYPSRQHLTITLDKQATGLIMDKYHVAVKLSIRIENIDIIKLFERDAVYATVDSIKCGAQYMGETGKQTLEIYTPIYVWLLTHESSLR
jgi:hypothetical protein